MLSHYRILDLTDGHSMLAGSLLADMGADVIQIEPPEGAAARRSRGWGEHPFDESPTWLGYARNKRGITIDLATASGKQRLLELVATADALIESYRPGYLTSLGLGYEDLARVNGSLVYVSISPYGQSGPKRDWPATDLTVWASAGYMFACGDADRPPIRMTVPQAFSHAGLDALIGTLIALRERQHSGEGQYIDISAQQSSMFAALPNQLTMAYNDPSGIYRRMAHGSNVGGRTNRWNFPAKDGMVSVLVLFGAAFGPPTARLFAWMFEEGYCDEQDRDADWVGFGERLTGEDGPAELLRVQGLVERFVASKTKKELFAAAFDRGLLTSPLYTVDEARNDPQLLARGFWMESAPNEPRGYRYPGPFVQFSESPLAYQRSAPRLGEHNDEVVAERPAQGVTSPRRGGRSALAPLQGVKVLDFGRVYVTPASTRPLSDFGATVIRVNSTRFTDPALTLAPMKDGIMAPERSGIFQDGNAGKLGIALNLSNERGLEVARKLAAWADVISEGFTPRVLKKFGLDYQSVRAINPGVVYVSASLCGMTGPYGGLAGYGTTGASLAGFHTLCGWPDRLPAGTPGAYTDIGTPRFLTAAILGALEHRHHTGVGQQIDASHIEACMHFLTPAFVEYELTGQPLSAGANRSPDHAPHGVFPSLGDDKWVAIAIEDGDQWSRLCRLSGMGDLANDRRLDTLDGRKACEDEIERRLALWTGGVSAEALLPLLIESGIPAAIVADPSDLLADDQLLHRQALTGVMDEVVGEVAVQSPRVKMSRTPGVVTRGAPVGTSDTHLVLSQILGYTDAEVADLAACGALE